MQTKEARNAIEAIRVFAMLERGGRHLPPDLRAAHRHYIHRSSVSTELLTFANMPSFASGDTVGNFFNATTQAVRCPHRCEDGR